MSLILSKLEGGDLRSIGNANELASIASSDKKAFDEIFEGIFSRDPLIAMRASDVIEKASQNHPEHLQPHKDTIINNLHVFNRQEVKWHIALMLSYIELNENELNIAVEALTGWLKDKENKSQIVKVNSLQALTNIAMKHIRLKNKIKCIIENEMASGKAAVKARGRKLLIMLAENNL